MRVSLSKSAVVFLNAFIILFILFPSSANANKFKKRAELWCQEYRELNPEKQCVIVHRGLLCPTGFARAKKFGGVARGYKACIPGSKRKLMKKGLKKTKQIAKKAGKKIIKAHQKVLPGHPQILPADKTSKVMPGKPSMLP